MDIFLSTYQNIVSFLGSTSKCPMYAGKVLNTYGFYFRYSLQLLTELRKTEIDHAMLSSILPIYCSTDALQHITAVRTSNFLASHCEFSLCSVHLWATSKIFLLARVVCFASDLRLPERMVSSNVILLELHKGFSLVIVTAFNTRDGRKRITDVEYIS